MRAALLPTGVAAGGYQALATPSFFDNPNAFSVSIADNATPADTSLALGLYVVQSDQDFTLRGENLAAGVDPVSVPAGALIELPVLRAATYTLTTSNAAGAKVNFYPAETAD